MKTPEQIANYVGWAAGAIVLAAFLSWLAYNNHQRDLQRAESVKQSISALPGWTVSGRSGPFIFIHMYDRYSDDKDQYRRAYKQECARKPICHVLFWPGDAQPPTSLPMLDAQVETQSAKIAHNHNTRWQQELWDCRRFISETQCLSK